MSCSPWAGMPMAFEFMRIMHSMDVPHALSG